MDIHKEIGSYVLDSSIDVFICVGELSRYSYESAKNGNNNDMKCYYFKDNRELLENVGEILNDGDMVLIKEAHGIKLVDVVLYLRNI